MPQCAECKAPSWWAERTKLEKCLILAVILTGAFALAITSAYVASILINKKNQEEKETKMSNLDNVCMTPSCIFASGTILENMDSAVSPCENFYDFACGNFIKKKIIPEDKSDIRLLVLLGDQVSEKMKILLEEPLQKGEPEVFQLMKKFYKTCMDTDAIEKDRLNNIRTILKDLGGWPLLEGDQWNESKFDWKELSYKFQNIGFVANPLLQVFVDTHFKNSSRRVTDNEDSIHLSFRKRFFTPEDMRKAMFQFMVDSAVLLGADKNKSIMEIKAMLDLKIMLLNLPSTNVASEEMTVNQLQYKIPNIPWVDYINNLLAPYVKISGDEDVFVFKQEYLRGLGSLLSRVSKSLNIGAGALFIRNYFNNKTKQDAHEMISNIHHSLEDTMKNIDWMDAKTKKNALDKLKAMLISTAYPEEFLDDKKLEEFYGNLNLDENDYLKLSLKLNQFDIRNHYRRLREPVNRNDWISRGRLVGTANAGYEPSQNGINIPAAILQDEMFDINRPHYLNYGAVGIVIGHELTHGFDNIGSKYDKYGNKVDWWTPGTKNLFLKKSQCFVEQYNKYVVPDLNLRMNGTLTLGENIADNGGVAVSYKAYQKLIKKHGADKTLPGLDYTQNQLFWISAANVWCSKATVETQQSDLRNVHSPDRFRVIGFLSNNKDFSNDFHCSSKSKMNPKGKCKLW